MVPFREPTPWLSVHAVLMDNSRVRRNLAELGEFMHVYSHGTEPIISQLISLPLSYKPPLSPTIHSSPHIDTNSTSSSTYRCQLPPFLLCFEMYAINYM